MANNEKQQIDSNVQEAKLVDEASSSSSRWLWLAIVLLLALFLGSGGWLYQQWQKEEQQQQQLLTQLSELDADNQALAAAQQQRQQQLDNMQQTQQQLNEQISELLAREQLSSSKLLHQWALQEIEYMLVVANQRALLAHDVVGAKLALAMADQQLEKMADYQLHPLRALIAEEMMALDALADVDISGMALKLQTAIKHVDELRVVKGPEVSVGDTTLPVQGGESSSWKQAAKDIWQQMRSLVVIRHNESGEQAVLMPEQRYFLYQNLKLQLESARLALLNRDDSSYDYALQTAQAWLQRYFTGDKRDALLATLQEMETQQIAITIPDISSSLNWLEEYPR